jgi:hypothetical protein
LAEALAYDPECVEAFLADAQGKTQWRAMLGLAAPSRQLNQAMCVVSRAVLSVPPLVSDLALDALHISCWKPLFTV